MGLLRRAWPPPLRKKPVEREAYRQACINAGEYKSRPAGYKSATFWLAVRLFEAHARHHITFTVSPGPPDVSATPTAAAQFPVCPAGTTPSA